MPEDVSAPIPHTCWRQCVRRSRLPDGTAARTEYLLQVGADGYLPLERIYDPVAPPWLRQIPAVQILRKSWIQQCYRQEGEVHVRQGKDLPSGRLRLASPYDPDARYGGSNADRLDRLRGPPDRDCNPDAAHVITHVATTDATVEDSQLTATIHDDLAARDLLVHARGEYGVELLGPVQFSSRGQAKTGGFEWSALAIAFDQRHATCPAGHTSSTERDETSRGLPLIRIDFHERDCSPCPMRPQCTTAKTGLRKLTIRPRE
ncbi:transposase [Acrocarpospora macrocephala]|uniref:transposase n=1 Tax=Acrocarpospora macrocephala TaxID=150177 RepID=UPI0031D46743